MPFCSKCGLQIKSDSRFCNACGSPVDVDLSLLDYSQVSPIQKQENIRQATIAEMRKMIAYFGQKREQYDEYDYCIKQLAYYNSNPSTVVNVDDQISWRGSSGRPQVIIGIILMVIPILFTLFYVFLLLVAISSASSNTTDAGLLDLDLNYVFGFLIQFVLMHIFLVMGIFLQTYGNKRLDKYYEYKKKLKALQQTKKEQLLKSLYERTHQLSQELSKHYTDYGYCAVGQSYTNPKILEQIMSIISLGRADTIKEAINTMLLDSHNSEMELQAKMAARSAELAAREAASAARGARAAAFFTAADFFLK